MRSVIGDLLHSVGELGGRVVSVTTDGFITDIMDLEDKVVSLIDKRVEKNKKMYKKRIDKLGRALKDKGLTEDDINKCD
jgi:high-affinity K+ transport system ATPase subunit B